MNEGYVYIHILRPKFIFEKGGIFSSLIERGPRIKKIRRKIEAKLRQDYSDEKIEALAVIMDISTAQLDEQEEKKK